jgi:hypothetical protein
MSPLAATEITATKARAAPSNMASNQPGNGFVAPSQALQCFSYSNPHQLTPKHSLAPKHPVEQAVAAAAVAEQSQPQATAPLFAAAVAALQERLKHSAASCTACHAFATYGPAAAEGAVPMTLPMPCKDALAGYDLNPPQGLQIG